MNMASDPNITAEMIEAAALAIADLIEKRHGGGLNMMGDARREEAKAALSAAFSVQPREGGGEWVGDKEYWEAPAAPVEPTSTPPALPLGWKAVPIEPTEAMLDEGEGFNLRCGCPKCDHEAWEKVRIGYQAMLSAAPVPPSQGEGWMPIESAPKDGRPVLVFDPRGDNTILTASHYAPYNLWMAEPCEAEENDPERRFPTHWMPLPKPPVERNKP